MGTYTTCGSAGWMMMVEELAGAGAEDAAVDGDAVVGAGAVTF